MISKEQILLGLYTYRSKIDLSKAKKKRKGKNNLSGELGVVILFCFLVLTNNRIDPMA
jgi:hypothetical protein